MQYIVCAKIMDWIIFILFILFYLFYYYYYFFFLGGGGGVGEDNGRPTIYGYIFIWDNGVFIQAGLEDFFTGRIKFSLI